MSKGKISLRLPLVPVSVAPSQEPGNGGPVSIEVPEPTIVLGLKEQDESGTLQLNVTVPLNPFCAPTVTLKYLILLLSAE